MSIHTRARGATSHYTTPFDRHLFGAVEPAGRRITAGFTYLQRIGKAASFDTWFPDAFKRRMEARLAAGQTVGAGEFPAHWAAVRQFELLQESGNHKIYDLDPQNIQRATLDLARGMRAGGYRVTVATLGSYRDNGAGDDLEILDRRLQRRLSQMIHMLYLDGQSEEINIRTDARLRASAWDYREQLPHIGMVLGSGELFRAQTAAPATMRKYKQAQRFFDILARLPQNHIVHDTAIGLQLPELNGENHWNYIAASDETLDSFNRVLNALFDPFNGISLSRLNGRADATAEIKSSTHHLRGYGHPLRDDELTFYRRAALSFH